MKNLKLIVLIILSFYWISCSSTYNTLGSSTSNLTFERIDNFTIKVKGTENSRYFYLIFRRYADMDEKIFKEYIDLIESMNLYLGSEQCHLKYDGFDFVDSNRNFFDQDIIIKFSLVDNSGKKNKITGFEEILICSEHALSTGYGDSDNNIQLWTSLKLGNKKYGNGKDCFLAFTNFSFGKTKAEVEKKLQMEKDRQEAKRMGFSSVEKYYSYLQKQEDIKRRRSDANFYNQVLYAQGIPLEKGDVFTISANCLKVVDRVVEANGYTYLVTFVSSAASLSIDEARSYGAYGGGFKHCFYIITKNPLYLQEQIELTTYERYVTNQYDLKVKCIGKDKYQRNYQDVDCYTFVYTE